MFVASFSPIVSDPAAAHAFYRDRLGLPLQPVSGDYIAADDFAGTRHLGVWPLAAAAESCFGTSTWPAEIPVPQATIEFEVATAELVERAADELHDAGYTLIHAARTEPWGQTITRLMGPEGLLIGVCHCPWMHEATAQ